MESELTNLVADYLQGDYRCEPLQGDGSERKIYRIFPKKHALTSIIAIEHKDLLENEAFVYITKRMRTLGLPAPEILVVSSDMGCYLTEDLGEYNLAELIEQWNQAGDANKTVDAYKSVIKLMPRFQKDLPELMGSFLKHRKMNHAAFAADLLYFQDNFIKRFDYLDIFSSKVVLELQEHLIEPIADLEVDSFVYRDFQARNIMWAEDKPHLIDYQSAMLGSRYYDLASLLYASKAGLKGPQKEELLLYYFEQTSPTKKFMHFEDNFYLFVLLRRLRSLGSYGYLSLSMGKKQFFASIEPTLDELLQLFKVKRAFYPFEFLYWMLLEIKDSWHEREAKALEELNKPS